MSPTVVEIQPRGAGASCALRGDLVVPRMIRRRGRTVDVALVAGRAMLLPGDAVHILIRVGEGCALRLVDIGGLVVYGRDGGPRESTWRAEIELAAGARLHWEGLPTVITDAAALRRSLVIRLGAASSATLRETLVLGRVGERGGDVTGDTEVTDATGPVLRETLVAHRGTGVPGILGSTRVMDSILAVGDCAELPDVAGATRLEFERCGVALRYMGDAAHESPLGAVFAQTSAALELTQGEVETTLPDRRPVALGSL